MPADFFSIWKPASHPDFPWTGIVFGAPILGVWYWCTDQYMVQRVLAAKSGSEARLGTISAGFLKILPVFIFVLPGVVARALYPEILGSAPDSLRLRPAVLRKDDDAKSHAAMLPVGPQARSEHRPNGTVSQRVK